MYTDDDHHAYVLTERCKGCALCVYVCSNLLKRDSIEMVYAENRDVAGVR
ncbi:ferredoxin [Hydrogenivirga sp. 128-5-R1-1]|nr:ferredoxin [Hydrogenivirga sp. 128-5-R1-1]